MSDLEYFFLGGKSSELQRHVSCRIYLLNNHLKTDTRFRALLGRLVPQNRLDILHARAKREVENTPDGVAYGSEGVDVRNAPALLRYLNAWEDPATDRAISDAMRAFVRDELKLEWAWLPHELERLMYYMCLAWMGIRVDIGNALWVGAGQKTGPGRYQRPNSKTVKKHVEWFYRHRMVGEKIAVIAVEADQADSTIKDAIHAVERVLQVSPTLL